MANASVMSAANRLGHAMKSLRDGWDTTKETWRDKVQRDFEERHLNPLETSVNSALDGMQTIAEVLDKVRRECSDRAESW